MNWQFNFLLNRGLLPKLLGAITFLFFVGCNVSGEFYRYNSSDLDLRELVYIHEIFWEYTVSFDKTKTNLKDCFLEIRNFYDAPIEISKWSIIIKGSFTQIFHFPEGTKLNSKSFYTIGRTLNGAFSYFDLVVPNLDIPNNGGEILLVDGSGKIADKIVFTNSGWPSGGRSNDIAFSMVRKGDFFGPFQGIKPDSWDSYRFTSFNVKTEYTTTVLCSPGGFGPDEDRY